MEQKTEENSKGGIVETTRPVSSVSLSGGKKLCYTANRRPKVTEEALSEVRRAFISSVQHLNTRIREEPAARAES